MTVSNSIGVTRQQKCDGPQILEMPGDLRV
jgi:hypothetical protein